MSIDRQRLISAARRLLPSRADAEDAVQDAYLRALPALYGAAPEPEPAQEKSSEELLRLRADCQSALRHLLSRTSLTEAASILLRDVFEFEYAEIAQLLGKTETACRQFLRRARTRARRTDESTDMQEIHVRWCWQAIEARDPARLVDLIQMRLIRMSPPTAMTQRQGAARSHTKLVQVNGRYALALMLDGVVLCVVPVDTKATAQSADVDLCSTCVRFAS